MGGAARMDRKKVEAFSRYWERMLTKFPEYRKDAVAAMGDAIRKDVAEEIGRAGLAPGAKGTVNSWQALRLGSGGGYAAVSPVNASVLGPKGEPKTWKGKAATSKQVTKWLERGHGTRRSLTLTAVGKKRGVKVRAGKGYVKGRQFYSRAKSKALDHALKAADLCLSKIEDELEYD